MSICKRCGGTRWVPFDFGGSVPCPDCKGTGEVSDGKLWCCGGNDQGTHHTMDCDEHPGGPADSKTNEEGE